MSDYQGNRNGGGSQFPRAGEGDYTDHSYNRYLPLKGISGNISFLVVKGMPRFKIYLKDPETKKLQVNLNPHHLFLIGQMVDTVCANKESSALIMNLTDYEYFGGKRSEEPMLKTKVIVTRNADKTIEIIFHNKKEPKAILDCARKFDFHTFSNADGSPLADSLASELNAKAIVKDWISILENTRIENHSKEHFEKKNSGSRGNNNRNFNNDRSGFDNNQQRPQQQKNEDWSSTPAPDYLDDDVNY